MSVALATNWSGFDGYESRAGTAGPSQMLHLGGRVMALTRCRCGTFTCWIDSVQHRLRVGGFSSWICDRHDSQIRGVD